MSGIFHILSLILRQLTLQIKKIETVETRGLRAWDGLTDS